MSAAPQGEVRDWQNNLPIAVIHGVSGATVIVRRAAAVKFAPPGLVAERLVAQARWLLDRGGVLGLPRVVSICDVGYTMERLRPITFTQRNATRHVLEAYDTLQRGVWCRPRTHPPVYTFTDTHALRGYIMDRAPMWLAEPLLEFLTNGGLTGCTSCDTHGDPTLDNLMRDDAGQLVIIDPLPASARIPELKAVDLGKLLQSAFGYELVKQGDIRWAVDIEIVLDTLKDNESEADVRAAVFFCAVHFLRLLPYQRDEVKRETYQRIVAALCARI